MFTKFARLEVDLEGAKTYYRNCNLSVVHWSFPAARPAPTQGCLLVLFVLRLTFSRKSYRPSGLYVDKDLPFA